MIAISMQDIIDMIRTITYANPDKRILITMVGIPGSGKTTAAKLIKDQLGFDKVSVDEIRKEFISSHYSDYSENMVFEESYNRLKKSLETRGLAVFDATNAYPKWRRKTNRICTYYYDISVCIYLDTSILTCLKRVQQNGRDDLPVDIIERMYSSLTRSVPSVDDGFDIVFRCKEFNE